jgi:hypothetical protein
MAYSTSNPPLLKVGTMSNVGNQSQLWDYFSTDAAATVDASGYITNAAGLGMRVGDLVYAHDTDATGTEVVVTLHRVVAINTNGSADLANGTTMAIATNSD